MVLSELVNEFERYILKTDPHAYFNYAPPSASKNHTVWNVRGTVKGFGDNFGAEAVLIVEVRRWCTRFTDENGMGGKDDPIVDALYSAFDTRGVTSNYLCDRDDKAEMVYHTWNVDYAAGTLYEN